MISIGHRPKWLVLDCCCFCCYSFKNLHRTRTHRRTYVGNCKHNDLICVYFQIKLRLHAFPILIKCVIPVGYTTISNRIKTITHRTIFLNQINTSNFRIVCRIDAYQNIANYKRSQRQNTITITHEAMHYVREPFRFST